jgi:hypothetical protein
MSFGVIAYRRLPPGVVSQVQLTLRYSSQRQRLIIVVHKVRYIVDVVRRCCGGYGCQLSLLLTMKLFFFSFLIFWDGWKTANCRAETNPILLTLM